MEGFFFINLFEKGDNFIVLPALKQTFHLFVLMLYITVIIFLAMLGQFPVFLGSISTKRRIVLLKDTMQ